MDKQNKRKRFLNVIIIIISITIVILLSMFLLDTTGRINQGNFRINDLAVVSIASVQDTTVQSDEVENSTDVTIENSSDATVGDSIESLSDLRLDVSQQNTISFLIANSNSVEINEIYIDNIKTSFPVLNENMYIYQNEENKLDLKDESLKLILDKAMENEQYLIKFNIDNVNCIKEAVIPEDETAIIFDGTIFNVLNTKISDISFNIQFDLNILDSKGKLNICRVKLDMPNELLITNGISIIKEDVGNFPFRIK